MCVCVCVYNNNDNNNNKKIIIKYNIIIKFYIKFIINKININFYTYCPMLHTSS